jgi:predicted PurR-regulated permease PerM
LKNGPEGERTSNLAGFIRRAAIALALASGFAAAALLIWHGGRVLLLCFAGILFAVFLHSLSCWVVSRFKLSYRWALTSVTITLLGISILLGWLLAPEIQRQIGRLAEDLPRAWDQVRNYLLQFPFGQQLVENAAAPAPAGESNSNGPQAASKAGGVITSLLQFIVDVIIVLFVGFYFASDPDLYVCGVVRLLPQKRRERIQEVLTAMRTTLQHWLRGRLLLMLLNGVVTALGLWLMGIPLALLLGLFSGLIDFIPNFGPIIAAVPAILIALQQSPQMALYVALFFFIYQNLDGYVLTPMVQKWTISLPPALTIIAQVLLGVLLGGLGLLLAVPLVAAGLIAVKMLYMEDVLHEKITLPHQENRKKILR